MNQHLDHLTDPSFQGVNKRFVLTFRDAHRARYKGNFFPNLQINDYSVMIDGQNFFDRLVKIDLITFNNNREFELVREMVTQLVVY